jgi:hypothetical protein
VLFAESCERTTRFAAKIQAAARLGCPGAISTGDGIRAVLHSCNPNEKIGTSSKRSRRTLALIYPCWVPRQHLEATRFSKTIGCAYPTMLAIRSFWIAASS